jgi:hypothetical protein
MAFILEVSMKASHRTLLAVAIFVPLAAILLVTFACLPVPVGDPDKSRVDPALAGIYRVESKTPDSKQMAVVRPWDDKTYLVLFLQTQKNQGKEEQQISAYKAWLTPIAEKTFMTLQPMEDAKALLQAPEKPYWVVMRLDKTDKDLEVRVVNSDSEFLKGLTKKEEFEAAIKAHVSDTGLYHDAIEFKKLGKDDQAFIDDMQGKLNIKGL